MSDRLAAKMAAVNAAMADIRRVVRQNGAPVGPNTDIREVAQHALNISTARSMARWKDIATLDKIKDLLYHRAGVVKSELSTQELLDYGIDDERLTADRLSWAVLRVTKQGTEILTYGGAYYQQYLKVKGTDGTPTGEYTRSGREYLRTQLERMAYDGSMRTLVVPFERSRETYTDTEGREYYILPIPEDVAIERVREVTIQHYALDGSWSAPGSDNAFELPAFCLFGDGPKVVAPGVLDLPRKCWMVCDNSGYEGVPRGILVNRGFADGTDYIDAPSSFTIFYSPLKEPLKALRLVSESFGDEYIISTQDLGDEQKGTWLE